MVKTTSDFIDKAIKIHGDKYDYSFVDYINTVTKVKIICKEHGEFAQAPFVHTSKDPAGCPMCGFIKRKASITKTNEEYLKSIYEKHGTTYNYDKVEYVGVREKIIINCSIHGDFKISAASHLVGSGCPACGKAKATLNKYLTPEAFIEKAVEKHGNKYDYSMVNYTTSKNKVEIICKTHGSFKQIAANHLMGGNCKLCANKKNKNAFTKTGFRTFCNKENRKATLYLIHFESGDLSESFYKIGITSRNVKMRTKRIKYNVISIITYENINSDIIYNLETNLHRDLKHQAYTPNILFGGHTECFNLCDEVLNMFKNKIELSKKFNK